MLQQQNCLSASNQLRPEVGRPLLLAGPNFSGRTACLRALITRSLEAASSRRPAAYIGPEVYNAVSALCATVGGELALHAACPLKSCRVWPLITQLGLAALLDRNPFTLSGGEQVSLCLTAALALAPELLAIDCVLEQLDARRVDLLINAITSECAQDTAVALADNACDDRSPLSFQRVELARPLSSHQFGIIDGTVSFPEAVASDQRITLSEISFRYPQRGTDTLRCVSVELLPGHVYHLAGQNGSGKSTLAKLLAGAFKPRSGEILLNGRTDRPWRRPGQHVAYHFQNPDLQLFSRTVREEIATSPTALRQTATRSAALMAASVQAFGLHAVLNQHPLDIPSFVMRKRIALAATLSSGAPWIILDEPTLGQDSNSRLAIASLIRGLATTGRGVIVISHSRQFIGLLNASRLILTDGRLSTDGGST